MRKAACGKEKVAKKKVAKKKVPKKKALVAKNEFDY
jgi:hypothetical protein